MLTGTRTAASAGQEATGAHVPNKGADEWNGSDCDLHGKPVDYGGVHEDRCGGDEGYRRPNGPSRGVIEHGVGSMTIDSLVVGADAANRKRVCGRTAKSGPVYLRGDHCDSAVLGNDLGNVQ